MPNSDPQALKARLEDVLNQWNDEVREHGVWTSGHGIATEMAKLLREAATALGGAAPATERSCTCVWTNMEGYIDIGNKCPVHALPSSPVSSGGEITFVDPSSPEGQAIIAESAYMQPTTQGDPPPEAVSASGAEQEIEPSFDIAHKMQGISLATAWRVHPGDDLARERLAMLLREHGLAIWRALRDSSTRPQRTEQIGRAKALAREFVRALREKA